jgi:hypothetical protein
MGGKDLKTAEKEGAKAQKKQGFNLQVPEPLNTNLREYVDEFERQFGVRPSMTKLFIQAMEEKLPDLRAKLKKTK